LEHPHRSALENHVHRAPRLDNHGSLNVSIGISRLRRLLNHAGAGRPPSLELVGSASRGMNGFRRRHGLNTPRQRPKGTLTFANLLNVAGAARASTRPGNSWSGWGMNRPVPHSPKLAHCCLNERPRARRAARGVRQPLTYFGEPAWPTVAIGLSVAPPESGHGLCGLLSDTRALVRSEP
jgi:hypothetical protein